MYKDHNDLNDWIKWIMTIIMCVFLPVWGLAKSLGLFFCLSGYISVSLSRSLSVYLSTYSLIMRQFARCFILLHGCHTYLLTHHYLWIFPEIATNHQNSSRFRPWAHPPGRQWSRGMKFRNLWLHCNLPVMTAWLYCNLLWFQWRERPCHS